ncbi:uncharacterized protein JCM15063_002404 [Sporobolomyces koalae]|uniref:uncharacterized protein n=1 Tax=Sporobolomyces koalae TaxID=500713 RepID=UPI0031807544
MAAFVPFDPHQVFPEEDAFGQGREYYQPIDEHLQIEHDLPPDLISPLPAYALYQHQEVLQHYTTLPLPKHRSNPFVPSPLGHVAESVDSTFSCSTLSSYFPSISRSAFDSNAPRPADSQLSTLASQWANATSVSHTASPGLHLNLVDPNAAPFSALPTRRDPQHSFLLTPPIEAPPASGLFNPTEWHRDVSSSTVDNDFAYCPAHAATPNISPFIASTFSVATRPSATPISLAQGESPSTLDAARSPLQQVVSSGLARRRARNAALPSPSPSASSLPSATRSRPVKSKPVSGGGARARSSFDEISASCKQCNNTIATLQLRGKRDDLDIEFAQDFTCSGCSYGQVHNEESVSVGYASTLSALLDREEGVQVETTRSRLGKPASKAKKGPRWDADEAGLLTCDVCRCEIATGSLRPENPDRPVKFSVEVICSRCSSLYRRCSDDGGGGGRLGVGKWRCKELFEDGRRNCSFSHARMGSIQDLVYDTHSIAEIAADDLSRLETICFEFFRTSVLSALAVPDVLEGEDPIAINFEQMEKLAVDSWTHFQAFFRADIPDPRKKRYLGLRWSNPTTRKKGRKTPASPLLSESSCSSLVVRSSLRLTGFTIMEVDLENGLVFTPLTMPMGSVGETYDASTTLLRRLSERIATETDAVNDERSRQGLSLYPPIKVAWTAVLFSKDTRGTNHLETRRGYSPLETFFSSRASRMSDQIRERMQQFVPAELHAGWNLFARSYGGARDDWGELAKSRRRRKSETGGASRREAGRKLAEDSDGSDSEYYEGSTSGQTSSSRPKRTKRLRS